MSARALSWRVRHLVQAGVDRLPAYVLLLMSLAFIAMFLCGRGVEYVPNIEVALLMPLCGLALPACRFNDGLIERWFSIALLLGLWLVGVQCMQPAAVPAGWHHLIERAAALAVCLFVAVRRVDARQMMAHLGRSATAVATISLVAEWHFHTLQPMNAACFGLAHINILANTVTPTLLMWLVLLSADRRSGKPTRVIDWVTLVIGCVSMGTIAVATQRRGILLAVGAMLVWLLFMWMWRRYRPGAWALIVTLVVAAVALVWKLAAVEVPSLRNERIDLYRGALEGIAASSPWGFGQYGMMHLQSVMAETCRHLAACGGWGIHVHDEFLDMCLDGGVVALIGMLTLMGILVTRLSRIRDQQVASAFRVGAVLILMLLLTDNIFGTMAGLIWLAVVTGMVLAEPVQGPALASVRSLPDARAMAWPLSLIALLGAGECFSSCVIKADAGAAEHLTCLTTAYDPQLIDYHAKFLLVACQPPIDAATRKEVLETATSRYGWKGDLAVLEARRAQAAGEVTVATDDMLRVLRFSPFYQEYYELLGQQLVAHHECVQQVPMPVQRRLAYLLGDPRLPRPDLSQVARTIEDAADAYAGIIWSISNGVEWSKISPPLASLCRFYGDIPGVASLVIKCARIAPAGSFPWLADAAPIIEVALRLGYSFNEFDLVQDAAQAQGVMPLIARLYPDTCAECQAGTVSDGEVGAQRKTIERIWHLAHTR